MKLSRHFLVALLSLSAFSQAQANQTAQEVMAAADSSAQLAKDLSLSTLAAKRMAVEAMDKMRAEERAVYLKKVLEHSAILMQEVRLEESLIATELEKASADKSAFIAYRVVSSKLYYTIMGGAGITGGVLWLLNHNDVGSVSERAGKYGGRTFLATIAVSAVSSIAATAGFPEIRLNLEKASEYRKSIATVREYLEVDQEIIRALKIRYGIE